MQVVVSHLAIARVKAGSVQIQVRFERLLQDVGALRPIGMQFCYTMFLAESDWIQDEDGSCIQHMGASWRDP